MKTVQFQFVVQAEAAICHAEGSIGNTTVVMRRKIRLPDGTFAKVPAISSASLRHHMRECTTYVLLDKAGLLSGDGPKLSESAVRLLFNGGMLTGKGDAAAIKLDQWKALVKAFPHIGLLGGCADNHMLPGQVSVSDMLLICDETQHLMPEWVKEITATASTPARDHMDEVTEYKHDAKLNTRVRELMSPEARGNIEARHAAREVAHTEGNAVAASKTKSDLMPHAHEVVVQGSIFYVTVTARVYDELEEDTLRVMIAALVAHGANAGVGGKIGTGHGKVRFLHAQHAVLGRHAEVTERMELASLSERAGSVFTRHVAENRELIMKALATVDA